MSDTTKTHTCCESVAIVGGGANALYLLERFLAHVLRRTTLETSLSITVYDSGGDFGAGCHQPRQSRTNHLNRMATQVALAADSSCDVDHFLDVEDQLTLYDWCRRRFATTGDSRYDISTDAWPDRALFGEALTERYARYVEMLNKSGVTVTSLVDTVVEVKRQRDGRMLLKCAGDTQAAEYHSVILCTGHMQLESVKLELSPDVGVRESRLRVYPTDALNVPPGKSLICRGMGLAAIDAILQLTEGRNGEFVRSEVGLSYLRSGQEPQSIVPYSETGSFLFAKAMNQKTYANDIVLQGKVLNCRNVDRLRSLSGADLGLGFFGQLDFEKDVLPLAVMEMKLIYYNRLFGPVGSASVVPYVVNGIDAILDPIAQNPKDIHAEFKLIDDAIDDYYAEVASKLRHQIASRNIQDIEVYTSFIKVVRGARPDPDHPAVSEQDTLFANGTTSSQHPKDPGDHLIQWNSIIDPLSDENEMRLEQRATSWLARDIADARQGNIDNPRKAAIDGVWRDLRDVIRYAVEKGGLTAHSFKKFDTYYRRAINRIAVGTSVDVMEKILALVNAGMIDLRFCRNPGLEKQGNTYKITKSPYSIETEYYLAAQVERFGNQVSSSALYRTLIADGELRQWAIPEPDGTYFNTGGLEVCADTQRAIGSDKNPNQNLYILGVATEGFHYFLFAAARPSCADPIFMRADSIVKSITTKSSAI